MHPLYCLKKAEFSIEQEVFELWNIYLIENNKSQQKC